MILDRRRRRWCTAGCMCTWRRTSRIVFNIQLNLQARKHFYIIYIVLYVKSNIKGEESVCTCFVFTSQPYQSFPSTRSRPAVGNRRYGLNEISIPALIHTYAMHETFLHRFLPTQRPRLQTKMPFCCFFLNEETVRTLNIYSQLIIHASFGSDSIY